jgi:sugar phosphate isomerase/epimerase
MHIGIRAHDFGKLPAHQLAQRIAAKNLSCVQLALNKAIEPLNLVPGRGDLTPGLAWTIGTAFAKHNLQIAVLGCYINLSNPDPATRAPLMSYFKEHLRCARDFGCGAGIVGTETGSLNADWSFHPDNRTEDAFKALVPRIAELVAEAEHFGSTVGIEGVASHVLDSPQRIRRLLDDIRSNNLQIIFDPVNLLDGTNYQDQDRIIKESLDLFGDRIAIIHAKDFIPMDRKSPDSPPSSNRKSPDLPAASLKQTRAGAGGAGHLRYAPLMQWLKTQKPHIPILLEEASEDTAEQCAAYLRAQ